MGTSIKPCSFTLSTSCSLLLRWTMKGNVSAGGEDDDGPCLEPFDAERAGDGVEKDADDEDGTSAMTQQ